MARIGRGAKLALIVAGGLGWVVAGTPAGATSVSLCLAQKLGDVGRTVAAEVACSVRNATKPNAAARAACLAKAERRFTGGDDPSRGLFTKREGRRPCPTVGDQDAIAADVAAYAAALDAAVGSAVRPSRCDAAKLSCVSRYVSGAFTCLARAAKGTGVIDAACLAVQSTRVGGCLGRAASRGYCSRTGDATALASGAGTYVAATLCALDPGGTAECGALPTPVPTPTRTATPVATRTPTPRPTGSSDAVQLCVDTINQYRASIGRAPLARWTEAETCVEDQGFADHQSGTPHSAFGQCSEWAQNECPGWPGPGLQMIESCLAVMWAEGPGQPYSQHGHYINMANPGYTKVACGFAELPNGTVWAVQDFR